MPKAHDVAVELRKLADGLDSQPDVYVDKPYVMFSYYEKEPFLATVRVMPRPLAKKLRYTGEKFAELNVTYKSDSIIISASVPQSKTCELVEPAKPAVYRCAPILSEEEDAAMEVTHAE